MVVIGGGMMAISREFPNGRVEAYWGTATSTKKQTMDAMDWGEAQKTGVGPNGESWSLTPQSGTIVDGSPQGYNSNVFGGNPYRGYPGNV